MREKEYIPGIDGLRAIAATLVVMFHYHVFVGSPKFAGSFIFGAGWSGVDIFFVISGFVLFLPILKAQIENRDFNIKAYYKKRFSRILPAYYFNLFVLVSFFSPGFIFSESKFWQILANATFTAGFIPQDQRIPFNPVYWTLWIEMQYYLILPLFALLFLGRKWWISAILIILSVLAYKWAGIQLTEGLSEKHLIKQYWINMQLPGVLQQFLMGIVAASIYLRYKWFWIKHRNKASLLAIIGIIMFVLGMKFVISYGSSVYWNGEGYLGYIPLITLNTYLSFSTALVLLGICSNAKWIKIVFANRIIMFLGTISYGIYLWHYPVGRYLRDQIPLQGLEKLWVLLILGFIFTVLWGYISYRFIELPFLKRKQTTKTSNQNVIVA